MKQCTKSRIIKDAIHSPLQKYWNSGTLFGISPLYSATWDSKGSQRGVSKVETFSIVKCCIHFLSDTVIFFSPITQGTAVICGFHGYIPTWLLQLRILILKVIEIPLCNQTINLSQWRVQVKSFDNTAKKYIYIIRVSIHYGIIRPIFHNY